VFRKFPFIPESWLSQWKMSFKMRGDESPLAAENNFILNNIHQLYESRSKEFQPNNVVDAILGPKPQKDLSKPAQTLLERMKELDNLLVMNDEAHHVHDEDLKWHESLTAIHRFLPGGLKMWLDFSATPKTPSGTFFAWTICDYPLAQAVEDRIVKVPLIVHIVAKKDPENITQTNLVDKYKDWISAALSRWKEHYDVYQQVDKKPVLFIMAEKNVFADKIAETISSSGNRYGIKKDEIMTIHTDNTGEVKKSELENLRQEARDIDSPHNKIKVIVSVLMLREGWDVQNGGLRLMQNISPDRTQTLEIIGNDNFENVVRQLELEGVGITTTNTPPPLPVTIAPETSRINFDIGIPETDLSYTRKYQNFATLDVRQFPSLYTSDKLDENRKVLLKMETMHLGVGVGQTEIDSDRFETGRDIVTYIVKEVMKRARITDCFRFIYPICQSYILDKCFDVIIADIENDKLRKIIQDLVVKEAIIDLLAKEIGLATAVSKDIEIKGKTLLLSKTPRFVWRRGHIRCNKTVFNFVATYNDYEKEFAVFLDEADDITAFAALANIFRIDYLSETGAIRNYFPDFVAIQSVDNRIVHWILETKGREYPDLENKNRAIERWCKAVTKQTKNEWKYMLIKQSKFDAVKKRTHSLQDLVDTIKGKREDQQIMVIE